ncbi:MAG: UDP-N-acetylglucosamine 2-epimerase (non-hydrolyzing) [Rhizobiales bacterium]|nr:UDP-N-acetylglucosamine 2-epimerase (non-hydrolyzing) [Hyphomicrobiales bacterium]MBO6698978.1 UDP-N-acetylglucosamine 2-epimerase (non-hydrolyzing) [Hyphomicrobiales bacterium]MBO6734769.1 UDP-N-acetylglucosamine 2-epimerase (non-hydrolyzing) [Hyphomicrobiales bacterium]MBO6911425.1 UDP-N-acetylglucosamine 2-epimerase (non-hydrolyzing) [Hyphomicrobiales bacterium]MBO6955442.1 UDP-N-acetylglucosamine 2-epimerase (non-hydrolyzing) [Hyphomicrobiales bacterium]
MLKVMTVVGTRPELIKMSRVIAEMDRHTDHVLVHTGQNYDYELNEVFFEDLGIRRPDHFLNARAETTMQTIGQTLIAADRVFEIEMPEALLLYGDTNSCLAVIAAKRRKIPVFHMEAGNRCFDQRVPEELNRKVVDHLSDINMVLSEHARRYLISEGLRPETIFKTGSHMGEVLQHAQEKIAASDALSRLGLTEDAYFLVSAHREENVDTPSVLRQLLDSLNALAETYGLPVIVSTHPRTRKRLDALDGPPLDPLIRFLKPFGFVDYIRLQMDAACVLSDSGTITEEAALLNLPAITIRTAHERPEGMDTGTLIMSGLTRQRVLEAVQIVRSQHNRSTRQIPVVPDYISAVDPNPVSKQVLRIVQSYTDYVNRTVWREGS